VHLAVYLFQQGLVPSCDCAAHLPDILAAMTVNTPGYMWSNVNAWQWLVRYRPDMLTATVRIRVDRYLTVVEQALAHTGICADVCGLIMEYI
jgi:hypothetical protein